VNADDPLVLGAALGDCVHVAGVLNFLSAARSAGYESEFLGPGVPVERVVTEVRQRRPALLAVSYRLTPEAGERLLAELTAGLDAAGLGDTRVVVGGTPPVAAVAERSGRFEAVFGGPNGPSVEEFLTGNLAAVAERSWAGTLVARRDQTAPRPLLRHHFGLPSVPATVQGIGRIADAGLLDVISLGTDQNAQEFFFNPHRMDPAQDGAGGVPIRTRDDLVALYDASRRGNFPLMRCYSGTNDQLLMAELLEDTIHNAWCAVPVFWYSELDGRSDRTLEAAITEHQGLVTWCAGRGIPVERNDQNQWALRYASDVVQVAAGALAASITAQSGIAVYVLQMMLNTPPGTSPSMDVAKMLAMEDLTVRRVGSDVTVLRELRAGLFAFPQDPDRARGQLASSTRTAMLLMPDILHVVAYTEADHATGPEELISSCELVHQVIDDSLRGLPDPASDPVIAGRRDELIGEAEALLDMIERDAPEALLGEPHALARVVRDGYFDAPYLAGNPAARGTAVTVVDRGCRTVDPHSGMPMSEVTRVVMV
jgi:methylmalonyl-CoA mutase cobalamin-binding subunit